MNLELYNRILELDNPVRNYAWGSHTAIAELLGAPVPSSEPQAELWMGAHPLAPSMVRVDGEMVSLLEVIRRQPQSILGEAAFRAFGPQLPFLFKVLAAARPLSIQAHPGSRIAREGYERENRFGLPLNDPRRNYRDNRPKPECLCAVTPFKSLSGFRAIPEMIDLLGRVWPDHFSPALAAFRAQPSPDGLKTFFESLLHPDPDARERLLEHALARAIRHADGDPAFAWVKKLWEAYPGDIGVLSPLMLNLVDLMPGEAIFLPPGQLHAYLDGVGMELMANSDNVLRGGLTLKHVDAAELMKAVDFTPRKAEKTVSRPIRAGERVYPTPAGEFSLSVITVRPGDAYRSPAERSIEILVCLQGAAAIDETAGGRRVELVRGKSVVVPAAVGRYRISGEGTVYKAAVPAGL